MSFCPEGGGHAETVSREVAGSCGACGAEVAWRWAEVAWQWVEVAWRWEEVGWRWVEAAWRWAEAAWLYNGRKAVVRAAYTQHASACPRARGVRAVCTWRASGLRVTCLHAIAQVANTA